MAASAAAMATTPPAHWSHFEQEQDLTLRELIRRVTGLSEQSEDERGHFQAALNFAWSNFRFHRFLDVSSHKLERIIEGIYEKLIVHSDLVKAASWKRLTEEFLNSPLPATEGTKTDTHYAILSLLLCLSDSPSNTNYAEKPRDKEVEKEEFDWGKYLMEGEEFDFGPDVETPEWSEVSDDEEDTEPLSREDSGIQVDRTPQEDQDQNKKSVSHITWKGEPDARTWLEQHIVAQYWTGRVLRFPHSLHFHSNLAAIWYVFFVFGKTSFMLNMISSCNIWYLFPDVIVLLCWWFLLPCHPHSWLFCFKYISNRSNETKFRGSAKNILILLLCMKLP